MLSNNEQNERKYRMTAFAGTLLFHVLMAGVLLIMAFHTSLPLPDEEGVEISFNYRDTTKSDLPADKHNMTPVAAGSKKPSKTDKEEVIEDVRETLSLSKKKTEKIKPVSGKIRKSIVETPDESTVVHKAMNTSAAKSNGNKHEIPVLADKPVNYNNLKEPQNQSNKAGKENGISFDLGGRKARILPKPSFNSSEDGKIVVSVKVNTEGKVISATAGDKGTTITEPSLFKQAENAARISLFVHDSNAPEAQRGTITYFVVKQK